MRYNKLISEILITFFLSYFLYSLVDASPFIISGWDKDKIINLAHTWLTILSSYYIYNFCLKAAFDHWRSISVGKLIVLLIVISGIVLVWFIATDILFYKLYYNVTSLLEETTFFDFDLPIAIVVLIMGSLFFYHKFYTEPIKPEKTDSGQAIEKLSVTKGNKQLFIDHKDIAVIYID